jgi:hypothetical protein
VTGGGARRDASGHPQRVKAFYPAVNAPRRARSLRLSMHRVIAGCETMYSGMSVSDAYLAATVNAAAVARHHGLKAFSNMSQMTLSEISITETTASPQHELHRLAEQALNWSGLPVVKIVLDCLESRSGGARSRRGDHSLAVV